MDKRRYADRPEQSKKAVAKRRKKIREMAIKYKGGRCQVCGYSKSYAALDFHHIDPSKKEFGIAASGMTRAWERVRKEIEKCVLICANCHRELHEGITQLPMATSVEN